MLLDEREMGYLERAADLAETRRGCTSPNPSVGALIVAGDRVVGEGYHVGPGFDHAEVAAMKDALRRAGVAEDRLGDDWLQAAGEMFRGVTMYVTLEPCCTYGRTPPCTDALVKAGFGRVVVGVIDPSPQVKGRGLDILRKAGMQVDLADGPLTLRLKRQNPGMRKMVTEGLPFVTYKYAMTLDGRVATDLGDSRWISGEESRALVHLWRAWSDAVVVGAGTAAADDPILTAREVACERQPLRVVVDRELSLSRHSNLVQTLEDGPLVVICGAGATAERRAEVQGWGVETAVVAAGEDGLDPAAVCRYLASRGVQTVLLEGGPTIAGSWWNAGVIDQVAAFVCPRITSGAVGRGPLVGPGALRMADAVGLREVEVRSVGSDLLITGYTREAV